MASLDDLNAAFAIPGVLAFDEPHPGFVRARITTPACEGELFLHGAHITGWQPAHAAEPVLFLSPRSFYEEGKAIRGGIPVIFPWFGARTPELTGHRGGSQTTGGPQHGFARTAEWTLAFAAAVGDDVRLVLTLAPSETSRAAGFDDFRCALEVRFGHELMVQLTVGNVGAAPLIFEEALHTYFAVADVRQVRVDGLAGAEFLDKADGFARKTQLADPLTFAAETDRAYLNTRSAVTIDDPGLSRRIAVAKSGSHTTVVWNPWEALAAALADLGADVWPGFVCVETANAAENRIALAPQEVHGMELRVTVFPLDGEAA
jgi:glucose-6-phosphate 1-epimerase